VSAKQKLIIVIEVETERDIPDIGSEVCKRIVNHPHVTDANVVTVGASLTHTHAPKPKTYERDFIGAAKES